MYTFFDIHSHLHDKAFDEDRDIIVSEMKSRGVGTITIGTGLEESKKAIALAEKYENVYATIGLHPADDVTEAYNQEEFEKLAQHSKVVGIGECGLDYFRLKDDIEAEKERQRDVFEKQIALSIKINKPLMLHGRPSKGSMDAYEDMINILEKYKGKVQGNAHFFVGDIEIAKRFIEINFTMSFSGVITFAKDYDDVVRYVPLEMIHAETDSPYATPAPFRGQRNTPLYVQEIVARIAVLRQQPMEEIRTQLLENAKRVFGV
jgi:TatD DNase family protein